MIYSIENHEEIKQNQQGCTSPVSSSLGISKGNFCPQTEPEARLLMV